MRSRGFEADIAVRPSQGLSLTAAFAYTDAVYKGYTNAQVAPEKRNLSQWQDLSGVAIPNISKFTYALAADYRQPVNIGSDSELYLRADYNHRSGFYTSDTYSAYGQTPGYGVLNARIGLRLDGDRWDLSLWARNLTDKEYFTSVSAATTGLITAGIGAGRQVGSTLRFNF